MPRYFFDLQNGDGLTEDHEGQELVSRAELSREITKILLDVAQEDLRGEDHATIGLTVRDCTGKVVSTASLTFANAWAAR